MQTTLIGKRLSEKLVNCPSDAYPHGVSEDPDGYLVIDGAMWISPDAMYTVTDNVRNRNAEEVNTIDSDWSVALA